MRIIPVAKTAANIVNAIILFYYLFEFCVAKVTIDGMNMLYNYPKELHNSHILQCNPSLVFE